jgi:hypothetical protein
MKTTSRHRRSRAAFTLAEIMTSLTVFGLVMTGALSLFLTGLRAMYRDNQRLATNATLRYFIAHVTKETLDSTEFYVFPSYQLLDGTVDMINDVSPLVVDAYGTYLAHGDCLVLATRVSADAVTSNIRQFRIYYRATASADAQAPIRYYESRDYGPTGTTTTLTALLNAVNLSSSRQVVANAIGRLRNPAPASGALHYPIFATESATASPTNDSVSVNVEVINGTTANNLLSSSSFNYTISPRK